MVLNSMNYIVKQGDWDLHGGEGPGVEERVWCGLSEPKHIDRFGIRESKGSQNGKWGSRD